MAELYDHVKSHMETEQEILNEYVQAVDGADSVALRYLTDLIVKDEARHHQIFRDMADTLRSEINLDGPGMPVPAMDFDNVSGANTLAIVNKLLRFELDDQQELKTLHRALVDDMPFYALLVELMQRDTDKHIAILRFAKKHIRNRRDRDTVADALPA